MLLLLTIGTHQRFRGAPSLLTKIISVSVDVYILLEDRRASPGYIAARCGERGKYSLIRLISNFVFLISGYNYLLHSPELQPH